jgi:hypothetical protein
MLFEPVIGSLREPSDFAGLPVIGEDGVRMEPPAWARRLAAADGGYLLLDELSTASPMVQAAMLGVVLDRRVGDLQLPATVRVYVAANAPDRAADGYDLAPPLANRLLLIDHQPTVDAWVVGMLTGFTAPAIGTVAVPDPARTGIACAEVAAFIRARPARAGHRRRVARRHRPRRGKPGHRGLGAAGLEGHHRVQSPSASTPRRSLPSAPPTESPMTIPAPWPAARARRPDE